MCIGLLYYFLRRTRAVIHVYEYEYDEYVRAMYAAPYTCDYEPADVRAGAGGARTAA
jgi:hypothetical protein